MMGAAGIDALLRSYPRVRPELPKKHRESYIEHYRANRGGESRLGRIVLHLESWMHRRVAENLQAERILEIGAGTLNHVHYHPHARIYDAVEPFRELWEDSPVRQQVNHIFGDLARIPEDERYDAIVSVAVLEHLTDLPLILARSGLLLDENGSFRAGFPSEGGFLWGLAWRATTGMKYRWDRGLDYGSIMRHEHVNTADEVVALLSYFYERIALDRFPAPWHHLSFYTVALAGSPRIDRCRDVVMERKGRHGTDEAGSIEHCDSRLQRGGERP